MLNCARPAASSQRRARPARRTFNFFAYRNRLRAHACEEQRPPRSHGWSCQGPRGHQVLLPRPFGADTQRDRRVGAHARGDRAPLPAHPRGARLRHAPRARVPAAAQGARARRRLSRVDGHRAPHQDSSRGAGARHGRLGGPVGARRQRHRVRRADLGAHPGAPRSACRQPISRARHLDGARAAGGPVARAPRPVLPHAEIRGADHADGDRPEQAAPAHRGMPAQWLFGRRRRAGLRRGGGRGAGVRPVRARGRGAQQLQPFAAQFQGVAGAPAACRCCARRAARSRSSWRASPASR